MIKDQLNIGYSDTIAAIATPPGNGGIGVIRLSGPSVKQIADQLLSKSLQPRTAVYGSFIDHDGTVIDTGIALYFPAPASYTGEDILELQAHGGSIILALLLHRVLSLGARPANPGEFTERAFLNGKLDLAQAEAVADLIECSTEQSARSAQRSMQGIFSELVNELIDELIELRAYVEAAIDFVDEEIDFLTDGAVEKRLLKLLECIELIRKKAQQGRLLRDGMRIVLTGKPNAGKSSLLNVLAGYDAAIVADIPGTTRDVLKEHIQIDGMPLHIIDTAGICETESSVEQEGIRRAHREIKAADKILLLIDIRDPDGMSVIDSLPHNGNVTLVYNKIDLLGKQPALRQTKQGTEIFLSVKTGHGIELLRQHLKHSAGYQEHNEDVFIARQRHLDALSKTHQTIGSALNQLKTNQSGELVAEELKHAQISLAEITGKFTTEDLLSKIFSSFCIGK